MALTGYAELSRCVSWLRNQAGEWGENMPAEDLLKLYRAWRASDWDEYLANWTPSQVDDALHKNLAPDWTEENWALVPVMGKPITDV